MLRVRPKLRKSIGYVAASAVLTLAAIGGLAGPSAAQGKAKSIACGQPYVVVLGDTLGEISFNAYGKDAVNFFYVENASVVGRNRNLILIGQVLQVPCVLGPFDVTPGPTANFEAAPLPDPNSQSPAVPAEAETVLVFNLAAAPNFIINSGIIYAYFADVSRVTDGRVQFIDPPVTNRDARAQLDIVLSGQVDGAYIFNGYLADSHPLLQLPMLPLMGGQAEQTAISLWRLHDSFLSKTDYFDGVHLLGFVGSPAAHIWRLIDAPVVPGEDLVEENEYTIPYFEGLDTRGAAVVREENAAWLAEFDESRGKPLTFAMAHGAALAGGIWNENRTVTEIESGVYTPTFSVFLSEEAWNRISPDDQAAITAISGEVLSAQSKAWDAFDNGLRQKMLDQGLDPVKADIDLLAEMQDRSRVGIESWIEEANRYGISGYAAVNAYIADLEKLKADNPFLVSN